MADPVVQTLNEWEWTKVATAVTAGRIYRVNSTMRYYQTHRLTGTSAPTAPTIGIIPDEAVRLFSGVNYFDIYVGASADIYVMCANSDADADDDVGKIRVDL